MIDELAAFAEYLNTCGYAVGTTEIGRILSLFSDKETDFTEYEDAVGIMRPVFSSTRQQYLEFPQYFEHFIRDRNEIRERRTREKELGEAREKELGESKRFQKKYQDASEKLAALQNEREKKARELEKTFMGAVTDPLSAKERKLLEKDRGFFEKMNDDFVRNCLFGNGKDEAEAKKAMKRFSEAAQEALLEGRMDDYKRYSALYGMAKKIASIGKSSAQKMNSFVKSQLKDEDASIVEMEKSLLEEKREHDRIQKKITEEIRKLEDSITVKDKVVTHREEFIGHGAVQLLEEGPDCLDISFNKLTESEETAISAYIRRNVLAFKTRMTRNIAAREQGIIDMQETVQQACRTGGVPMILCRKKKTPGKTNLVLVLDVSGSCKNASGMMLTFIYYLQQVFPNGCRAFAFVNSLYDISDVMKTDSIKKAAKSALGLIPRRGIYSDYTKPLMTLWEEKRNVINGDSLIIFIGDARNNHRAPCEEYLKNICHRAKRAYWLNTETRDEWNKADSEADSYARFARMFEVTTPGQLIWFLNEGLK